MDYRGLEALLASTQALRAALGIHAVPDRSTLWWCSRHKVKPRLLDRVHAFRPESWHLAVREQQQKGDV